MVSETLVLGLRLVGGIVLLASNGFFVTTEFALTRVRQFSKSDFDSSKGLKKAWDMTERLEVYLTGCQLGITISSIGLGVVAEPAVAHLFSPIIDLLGVGSGSTHAISAVVSFAFINLLHLVLGEQVPTYLGVERTKTIAKYCAPVHYWWTKIMSPVIVVGDRIAKLILRIFGVEMERSWAEEELEEISDRAELRGQIGEILSRGELSSERKEEVINALEIGEKEVRDIMIDRDKIVALSEKNSFEENLETIQENPHSRFPLVGDSLEDFIGIVYTPALLLELDALESDEKNLSEVVSPPMTVAPNTRVSDLIDQFQTQKQELALVLDGGEVVGLVTATDAFEEITGDIEDPLDEVFDLGT